ncbi:ABC transporter ATP-binding protein [Limnovirga soli]|uniref:ATP-binding cassette domain-containing protein n=1 Tax=Limnovirga soli TaxID=2656915 RepID=A0A8J8FEE3_9BACT|nr:ABC transporter ATP-binding protein [Limnovirga soli]NNV55962.1 ATP-binding cassette domain-containing protein [Limnovirga soli]
MSGAVPKKKIFDFSLMRRVFVYVKPYRLQFISSVVLAIVLAFITPVRPMFIQLTIDKATGKAVDAPAFLQWIFSHTDLSDAGRFIVAVTIFQVVFLFVETALRFLFSFLTAWLGQSVVKDMRVSVFDKVLHLNLKQFDNTPIGTLTTRTINDIENINDIFADGLIPILADLLSIIIVLTTMFATNWQLTFIALIPFPFLIMATYYFKESVNKSFIKVRNAVTALNAFVQEHITGMHVVQAFAAEDREFDKFTKINKNHRDANIKSIFAYSVFFPVVEITLAVSTGLLVWWLAGLAANNPIADQNLAGELVAFILYLNQIFRPLRVIADKFNILQMGMISAERIFKVMDNEDFTPNTGTHSPAVINGHIQFNNVSFAYTDDNYVLKHINLEVKAGETVALVGHTGSGKTSIISVLNRLYPIQQGNITLDGVDINAYQLDSLRSSIGVVLQDVFLFSGSVMDNITLRNKVITTEQVIEAAAMIGVHDFIMQLPGGYEYNVMERGTTLSMGQRQLISFIRALLYKPAVLILDEATSSIDTESEMLIQNAIDTLIKGRTSIVIAHRLSTIRKANKIIVLDKGEIKEVGNHEDLMLHNGFYAKLINMQFEKQKTVAVH